jgi:predicted ester cyclase
MRQFAVVLSVVAVVTLGTPVGIRPPTVVAQGATPSSGASPTADCPSTSEAENEAMVRHYTEERWTDSNVHTTLVSDELVVHRARGNETRNLAEAQEADRAIGAGFPDVQVTVEALVIDGELAAVAWSAEGTNQGEFYGVPATGQTGRWEGVQLIRIACGQIVEVWESADALGLLYQLGTITDEELASVGTPTP